MKVTDQLNRTLTFNAIPARIVCLVPSLTELLVHLGLDDAIVGVTKFCIHPTNIRKDKTVVGGTKKVNIKTILELAPDIIIANKEENTKEMIESLVDIAPVHVSDINSITDCFSVIQTYGKIFSKEQQAEILIDNIKSKLAVFKSSIEKEKKLSVAYFIWRNPWMAVGSQTYIDYMLGLNNFENYYSNTPRYPEIKIEDLDAAKVDVIFLSSEPYPFTEKHVQEIKEFLPSTKVILVDGEMFSWYGSRILKALDYFDELNKRIR